MTQSTLADPARRSAVKRLGAAALGMALSPYVSTARAQDPLFVNTWGGIWDRAAQAHLFDPFTKETGIPIRTVSPVSYARLAAQAKTGVYDFDVTAISGSELIRAERAGLIEPIDESLVDVASLAPGQRLGNGIGSHVFATLIAYRKDKLKEGPQNWAQFWDVKTYPGTRSLQRYAARVLPLGLMADGVAPAELYPLDLDRAFASMDRIKPDIRVWWTQGQQSYQLLRDGEVTAMGIWHGRAVHMAKEGVPIEIVWNQAQIDQAYWVVSKGSPRAKAGWRFIASALRAERLAGFCMDADYSPIDQRVFAHIPEDAARYMPTYPENYAKTVQQDFAKLTPQLQELNQRFDRWVMR